MKARKLLHTRYRVNDLEKTVRFYKEVLGLEELRRHKSPRGSELVFLKAPESEEQIELCSFPSSGPVQVQPDLTHLAFEVDNLEEFGKHLAKLGLKYSDGPTTGSNGMATWNYKLNQKSQAGTYSATALVALSSGSRKSASTQSVSSNTVAFSVQ